MPAPAAAAALPVVLNAGKAVGRGVLDAATADLLVIRTQTTHGRGKKKRPVDLELHVNPAALGATAVGAGLALWLMQLRVAPTTQNVEYGQYVWSDGTSATAVMAKDKLPAAPPERSVTPKEVWVVDVQYHIPFDYTMQVPCSPDTPGAYLLTTVSNERATYRYSNTISETRMAVKSRSGFLGNGEGTAVDNAAAAVTGLPWWAHPLGWLARFT